VMRRFKSQSLDTPAVITRVAEIFRGKPRLILVSRRGLRVCMLLDPLDLETAYDLTQRPARIQAH
jgi:hypothetical protein